MPLLRHCLSGSLAIVTAIALSACAQHGGALVPTSSQSVAVPNLNPPSCANQVNESEYSTVTGKLRLGGGAFCIPAYGGYGGKLDYPNLSSAITLTLSSSTQNYDNFPALGSGTPIFYLAFSTSGAVNVGKRVRTHNGLSGKQILVGDPYTAYGEVTVFGFEVKLGPCYTTATKGKYGGLLGGIGGLLKGQQIPEKVSGVIEIYSGQQTSTKC
jgi:hypothetical protein